MLEGRLRDPLVGRHLLFGAMAGLVYSAIDLLPAAAPMFGIPPPAPTPGGISALGGFQHLLAAYFDVVETAFGVPIVILFMILLLRVIFRKPWIAYLVFIGGLAVILMLSPVPWYARIGAMLTVTLAAVVLTRLGLFAMLVSVVFSSWSQFPLTLDPASWYFPYAVVTMLLFAAVAVYGFVISLGGQLKFSDPVLD